MSRATQQQRARGTREQIRRRIVAAATGLVRDRSYAELSIGAIMERAGFGRTIFYRHFDDLADLLVRASREAIEELYDAQVALAATRIDHRPEAVREAIEVPVAVYRRHGPLLRAVAEAAADDEQVAAGQAAIRRRFDELVVRALHSVPDRTEKRPVEIAETARALNLLNESYLLDAFGRAPRVTAETAVETLTAVWMAVINQ